MPSTSPDIKRSNIERFGATVTVVDGYYDDAQAAAEARRAETGALEIHPYDHPATVAGQGTMGESSTSRSAGSTRSSSRPAVAASSPARRRGSATACGS
jgi:hypothetical protein